MQNPDTGQGFNEILYDTFNIAKFIWILDNQQSREIQRSSFHNMHVCVYVIDTHSELGTNLGHRFRQTGSLTLTPHNESISTLNSIWSGWMVKKKKKVSHMEFLCIVCLVFPECLLGFPWSTKEWWWRLQDCEGNIWSSLAICPSVHFGIHWGIPGLASSFIPWRLQLLLDLLPKHETSLEPDLTMAACCFFWGHADLETLENEKLSDEALTLST